MTSEIINCEKDALTGFRWCIVNKEGLNAFAAESDADEAVKKARLRLESFIRRKRINPLLQFPGPGYGFSEVTALCSAWQSVFLSAVNVKLRYCGIIPPLIDQNSEQSLYILANSYYSDTESQPLLRDCSMMKGYPVLGLEINGKIYTGTGISNTEALINCVEYEILERKGHLYSGIEILSTNESSYPPMNPFHTNADDALLDYIKMAEKYGSKPKAKNLSEKDFYIYQLYLEDFDARICNETAFIFGE